MKKNKSGTQKKKEKKGKDKEALDLQLLMEPMNKMTHRFPSEIRQRILCEVFDVESLPHLPRRVSTIFDSHRMRFGKELVGRLEAFQQCERSLIEANAGLK